MAAVLLGASVFVRAAAGVQDFESAIAAAVRISGPRAGDPVRGSGFVVCLEENVATIVTASHVIAGADFFYVEFSPEITTQRYPVDSILPMQLGNQGLAVFQIRGALPPRVKKLDLDVADLPRGEPVVLVGFPQMERTPLTTRRTVSGRRAAQLILDAPVGEGSSGGPVVRGGRVVGVVTDEDERYSYAVVAAVVQEFLRGSGIHCAADPKAWMQATFDEYRAAFESLSMEAVRRFHPTFTRDDFRGIARYEVTIKVSRIETTSTRATAYCLVTYTPIPRPRELVPPVGRTFYFRQAGDAWVFERVE